MLMASALHEIMANLPGNSATRCCMYPIASHFHSINHHARIIVSQNTQFRDSLY